MVQSTHRWSQSFLDEPSITTKGFGHELSTRSSIRHRGLSLRVADDDLVWRRQRHTGGAPGSGGSSVVSTTGSGGSDVSGTGGGAMAAGGSAGSAAVAMVDCTKDGSVMVDAIADFEMGSADINSAPGRKGSFFTYNDLSPTGVETPPMDSTVAPSEIPGKRCTSKFALHVSAKGFTTWGAGFGSDIAYGVDAAAADSGANPRGSYDASAYAGITFWARSEPGSKPGLRMNVADKTTAPEGGKCVVDMTGIDAQPLLRRLRRNHRNYELVGLLQVSVCRHEAAKLWAQSGSDRQSASVRAAVPGAGGS